MEFTGYCIGGPLHRRVTTSNRPHWRTPHPSVEPPCVAEPSAASEWSIRTSEYRVERWMTADGVVTYYHVHETVPTSVLRPDAWPLFPEWREGARSEHVH